MRARGRLGDELSGSRLRRGLEPSRITLTGLTAQEKEVPEKRFPNRGPPRENHEETQIWTEHGGQKTGTATRP